MDNSISDIMEVIKKRNSCKSFKKHDPLPQEVVDEIEKEFEKCESTVPDFLSKGTVKMKYIKAGFSSAMNKSIYKNAIQFLIFYGPAIKKNENDNDATPEKNLLKAGYLMEKMLLFLTKKGISSSPIGGKAATSEFLSFIKDEENHEIYIISPLGETGTTSLNKLMLSLLGTRKRKDNSKLFFSISKMENFSKEKLQPLKMENDEDGKYKMAFEAFKWAPSHFNKQPWKIIKEKENNRYNFFIDSSSLFYSRLGIGAAIANWMMVVANTENLKESGELKYFEEIEKINKKNFLYVISWSSI